jgi:hypothetical protein
MKTYKAIEADPVWMHLTARSALYLEGVEVWLFLRVLWPKVGDPTFIDELRS